MRLTVDEHTAAIGITVEIEGIGTVLITGTDDGIVADIFATNNPDNSVASTRATYHELFNQES